MTHFTRRFPVLRRRRQLPVGVALVFAPLLCACSSQTISRIGIGMSDAVEPGLAASVAQSVLQTAPIVDDPAAKVYLDSLTNAIARKTARPNLAYDTYVVDNDEINAFTVGGGYVFYNKGFIARCQNESQLAGVIGHEIGHNVGRHVTKSLLARLGIALAMQIARGEDPNESREIAAGLMGVGGALLAQKLSRDNEADSDRMGVESLVAAGIDPEGLPSFFAVLRDHYGDSPAGIEQYFADHPPIRDRIAHTRDVIAAITSPPGGPHARLRDDSARFRRLNRRMKDLTRYAGADTFSLAPNDVRAYRFAADFKDASNVSIEVAYSFGGPGGDGTRVVVTDTTGLASMRTGRDPANPTFIRALAARAGTVRVPLANSRRYVLAFDNPGARRPSPTVVVDVRLHYRVR